MKKSGILHAQLIKNIAQLGHFDSFMICDMGFPIPKDAEVIDFCFVRGVLGFRDVFKEIFKEVVVQDAYLMDGIKDNNPSLHKDITEKLNKQKIEYMDFPSFREKAGECCFFIRTAEDSPCSNIILVSASGVLTRVEQFDVEP